MSKSNGLFTSPDCRNALATQLVGELPSQSTHGHNPALRAASELPCQLTQHCPLAAGTSLSAHLACLHGLSFLCSSYSSLSQRPAVVKAQPLQSNTSQTQVCKVHNHCTALQSIDQTNNHHGMLPHSTASTLGFPQHETHTHETTYTDSPATIPPLSLPDFRHCVTLSRSATLPSG